MRNSGTAVQSPPRTDSLTSFSLTNSPSPYAHFLSLQLTSQTLEAVQEWVRTSGQAPTLLLIPKPTDECRQTLAAGNLSIGEKFAAVQRSATQQFRVIRLAVEEWADPRSGSVEWNTFLEFPNLHCCAIRRPHVHLRKLLDSKLCDPTQGIIAHVAPNVGLHFPEASALRDEERKALVRESRERVERIARSLGEKENDYLDSLGVGSFADEWAQPTEARGCILDTGVDESHCALQKKILVHALYDQHGQFKNAPDATDRGCHGTKITGIVAARTVVGTNLGLNRPTPLRLGVCPGSKVAIVNVAQGAVFAECSSLTQITAGMDWAIANRLHPDWGGYEAVNLSLELMNAQFSRQATPLVDNHFEMMRANNLFPVLAAGNEPDVQLGSLGNYIAASTDSLPASASVQITAPGALLCCQPAIDALENDLLGHYPGSSQATAFVMGVLLQLSGRAHRSVRDCYEALRRTRDQTTYAIRPAAAFNLLMS